MATTQKTTKRNSNQVYNHPVYKYFQFEIHTGIPASNLMDISGLRYKPGYVTLVTDKGKVVAIVGYYGYSPEYTNTSWIRTLKYVPNKKAFEKKLFENATGRFGLNTVVKMLNSSHEYPRLLLAYGGYMDYVTLPPIVSERLGLGKEWVFASPSYY